MAKIVDQKDFFGVCKGSQKVIVLFTRDSNKYGQVMMEHMTLLAQQHLEARFVWVDAENAPFLTDKLNIWMLPTICCIIDNNVKEQHNGLNEIDGSGKYSSGMLEYLLHLDGMLDEAPLYDANPQPLALALALTLALTLTRRRSTTPRRSGSVRRTRRTRTATTSASVVGAVGPSMLTMACCVCVRIATPPPVQ